MITSKDHGKRIDSLVCSKLKDYSRNRLQSLILNGKLIFNDKTINQPSYKLKDDGIIKLIVPEPIEPEIIPQKLDIKVVYEDKNLIVIDKEPGVVVHPGSGNHDNTLVNALLSHCKNNLSGIGGVLRPGVVHRIDKMTSGLIVFAKDDHTHSSLSEQFKEKKTEREYNLLVWNLLPKSEGSIDKNISRSKFNRKKMSVCNSNNGKKAITKYTLIKSFLINENIKISYLKCKLLTGRTHQIRVHMSHIGNPLIGDRTYSRNNYYLKLPENLKNLIFQNFIKSDRQALHARYLGFYHPFKKKKLVFESKLPKDFLTTLNNLDNLSNFESKNTEYE